MCSLMAAGICVPEEVNRLQEFQVQRSSLVTVVIKYPVAFSAASRAWPTSVTCVEFCGLIFHLDFSEIEFVGSMV